jgi:hypothetical protein
MKYANYVLYDENQQIKAKLTPPVCGLKMPETPPVAELAEALGLKPEIIYETGAVRFFLLQYKISYSKNGPHTVYEDQFSTAIKTAIKEYRQDGKGEGR